MPETLDLDFVQKHAIFIAWLVNTIILLGWIGWMELRKISLLSRPVLWLSVPWLTIVISWILGDAYMSISSGVTECPFRRCNYEAFLASEPVLFWFYLAIKFFTIAVVLAVLCSCVFLLFRKRSTGV